MAARAKLVPSSAPYAFNAPRASRTAIPSGFIFFARASARPAVMMVCAAASVSSDMLYLRLWIVRSSGRTFFDDRDGWIEPKCPDLRADDAEARADDKRRLPGSELDQKAEND